MAVEKYSNRSIWVHWLSAGLLLLTIPTGLAMSETEGDAAKLILYKVHFVIGVLVFALALFHVYIYFKDERPPAIDTGNGFRNKFISVLHRVLTILIIALTITGVGSLFTTSIWKATMTNDYQLLSKYYDAILVNMHHTQGILFIVLILLHIGGVLLYRLQKDKAVLRRMGLKI